VTNLPFTLTFFVIQSQLYANDSFSRIETWLIEQREDQVDLEAYHARTDEETVSAGLKKKS
jgi:hypothetical protein